MTKMNFYLVSYDRLDDKVIDALDEKELNCVKCYTVQKGVAKKITPRVETINEWELPWNDYGFQCKQYYEYGSIVHLVKNPYLLDGLTHVGLLHYDALFNRNSVNDILASLDKNPNQIFYQRIRGVNDLYLTENEVSHIANFMNERLDTSIDPVKIWNDGWISESLSVTPVEVFKKFGNFIIDYQSDIEDILLSNRWGIMNQVNHRICGIVERMWGFYLVSFGLPLEKMNIEHDWNSYIHKHQTEENWIK
jgi:hypothetical protein